MVSKDIGTLEKEDWAVVFCQGTALVLLRAGGHDLAVGKPKLIQMGNMQRKRKKNENGLF